jgi:hypothetical protein
MDFLLGLTVATATIGLAFSFVATSVRHRAAGASVRRYRGPRRAFSLVALLAPVALALALSASPQARTLTPALNPSYPDSLAVSPTTGPPGSRITITGTGWDPGLLSNGGSGSSGLPIIYEAPRPASSGLAGTGACSPHCYGKQVASTSTGSPGCNPCDFTVTTTVPSDAPREPGAFQVGTAAGPAGQAADFTVTQPTTAVPAPTTAAPRTPPGHAEKQSQKQGQKHGQKQGHKVAHKHGHKTGHKHGHKAGHKHVA